jgi:hypothetical protein
MPDQDHRAAIIDAIACIARAQEASKDGLVYLVVNGPVRGEMRTFIRDARTHRYAAQCSELLLASCQNGAIVSLLGGLSHLFGGSI